MPAPPGKPAPKQDLIPPPLPPDPPPPDKPGITASRSYYDAYTVVARAGAGERFTVAFWNLSDQDLYVTAGGQMQLVARRQKWSVELPRQFRWQVTGREAIQEVVPENETGVQIIIRR